MPQQYSDNNPLDKQFREELQNQQVTPRGRVWNRIAGNLDTAAQKKLAATRRLYVALGLIGLVGVTSLFLFTGGTKTQVVQNKPEASFSVPGIPSTQSVKQAELISPNKVGDLVAVTEAATAQGEISEKLVILNTHIHKTLDYLDDIVNGLEEKDITEVKAMIIEYEAKEATQEALNKDITPQSVAVETAPAQELPTTDVAITAETHIKPIKQKSASENFINNLGSDDYCLKGLYIGVGGALNNTWMFDKKAVTNINFNYKFTLGQAYAVKAGYNFSNNFGIEAGWNIHAVYGQKYTFLPYAVARVDMDELENHIRLKYTQIPVVAKLKLSKVSGLTHQPVVLNYELGAQLGHLKGVERNGTEMTNTDRYKQKDIAILGGVEYDIYFTPKAFVSFGVKASYGTNIYQGLVSKYSEFNSPHNLSAGLNIGINYTFSSCK